MNTSWIERRTLGLALSLAALGSILPVQGAAAQDTVRFVGYNLENYLPMTRRIDGETIQNAPKPESEKRVIVASLAELKPDILGVCEIGDMAQVEDLRARLGVVGLVYPHVEWVGAADEERHLALFSKFPIVAKNSQTDLSYLLGDTEFPVRRGFLDVTIEVNPGYRLHCIGCHLKSKRDVPEADETLMRRNEADLLRHHIDSVLAADPKANLLAYGDFNDTRNESPIKSIQGLSGSDTHLTSIYLKDRFGMAWTHHWDWANIYSRLDFIFVNSGLHSEIVFDECSILWRDDWEEGSDHRPLLATIRPVEK